MDSMHFLIYQNQLMCVCFFPVKQQLRCDNVNGQFDRIYSHPGGGSLGMNACWGIMILLIELGILVHCGLALLPAWKDRKSVV